MRLDKKTFAFPPKKQYFCGTFRIIRRTTTSALHNTNLQPEIETFVASQEADVLQDVPQDIASLIKENPKITREELAKLLHVSVKTMGCLFAKLTHIKLVMAIVVIGR